MDGINVAAGLIQIDTCVQPDDVVDIAVDRGRRFQHFSTEGIAGADGNLGSDFPGGDHDHFLQGDAGGERQVHVGGLAEIDAEILGLLRRIACAGDRHRVIVANG